MNPNITTQETCAAFQRYLASNDSSEIDNFPLKELRSADEQLGQRDTGAGFRIAMQNKIKDLELKEAREHESKIRALNIAIGILIGVVVAGLASLLY
jgi:hypothetical protein